MGQLTYQSQMQLKRRELAGVDGQNSHIIDEVFEHKLRMALTHGGFVPRGTTSDICPDDTRIAGTLHTNADSNADGNASMTSRQFTILIDNEDVIRWRAIKYWASYPGPDDTVLHGLLRGWLDGDRRPLTESDLRFIGPRVTYRLRVTAAADMWADILGLKGVVWPCMYTDVDGALGRLSPERKQRQIELYRELQMYPLFGSHVRHETRLYLKGTLYLSTIMAQNYMSMSNFKARVDAWYRRTSQMQ